MAILTVGATQQYQTISAAVAAAKSGDTVQIQAGTYTNDFPHVMSAITIEGVGGTVHLVATVPPPDGKSIMTVDASATIRNLDFSGSQVRDNNGAGIRYEAGDLVLQNCSFHDNQNGLLGNPVPGGTITIDGCTFNHNGIGDGYTHNLYVGDIATLTVTNSTFTAAVVGHEIKSRAENNIIQNNLIADGPSGTASYSIDLPNGGKALIQGNTIEKGPMAQNSNVIHFGGEGIPYAGSALTITGNTITNDLTARPATLLLNQTLASAVISNNNLLGTAFGSLVVGPATLTGNTYRGNALPDSTSVNLAGGNTTYFTDALDHSISLSTFQAVVGGAGRLTATGLGHDTAVGGSGGLTWTGQTGADTIFTKAGVSNTIKLGLAGNTIDSEGTDVITGTTGNDNYLVNGRATIEGSTGNSGYVVNGSAVIHARGSDSVSLGATASAQITAGTFFTLASNGGSFTLSTQEPGKTTLDTMTVTGGSVSLKAYGSGINVSTGGGAQGIEIDLGTGVHNVLSTGPDTIRAGAGSDTVIVAGSALVYGGSGALAVYARAIAGQATVRGGTGSTTIDGNGGHIVFLAGAGPTFVEDRMSGVSIVGGAGKLTVNADAYVLTVNGGTGGLVFTDKFGGHTITTAAGAKDTISLFGNGTVLSNGTDTITLGNINSTVTVNGASTVFGGTGNNSYVLNGQDQLLNRSLQIDRVTVGAAANVQITSLSTRDVVSLLGGQVTYFSVDGGRTPLLSDFSVRGTATIDRYVGSAENVTTAGGAHTQITTGDAAHVYSYGTDTISAGAGAIAVQAFGQATLQFGAGGGTLWNPGSATVQGGAGAVSIEGGTGALKFTGAGGNAYIHVASGTALVVAGSGNTTLLGGARLDYQAGGGSSTLQLGAGDSTIRAGAGATTVQAGIGHEVIEVQAGRAHGHELVTGFDQSKDSVQLDGYAAGSSHVTAYAGGVQLNLSDGTQIQFAGLTSLRGF